MDVMWKIIGIVFFIGILLMFASFYEITITETQAVLVGVLVVALFIGGGAYFFWKDRSHFSKDSDYVKMASEYAVWWAKETLNMELELLSSGNATTRSFPGDPEIFVGMRLNRRISDPHKPGLPVTMVVGTKHLSVRDFQDNPGIELMKDPFVRFATNFSGSPTPFAKADLDMSSYRREDRRDKGIYINAPNQQNAASIDDFFRKTDEN